MTQTTRFSVAEPTWIAVNAKWHAINEAAEKLCDECNHFSFEDKKHKSIRRAICKRADELKKRGDALEKRHPGLSGALYYGHEWHKTRNSITSKTNELWWD